jgi:hypothetical protein
MTEIDRRKLGVGRVDKLWFRDGIHFIFGVARDFIAVCKELFAGSGKDQVIAIR